jgi:hypothetical protein
VAVNWLARDDGGSLAWASRLANTVAPSAGTLRLVGQQPVVSSSVGVIDGGGDISYFIEADYTAIYQLLGAVTQNYTATWQVAQGDIPVAPLVGTLRFVGQTPTVAATANVVAAPLVATLRLVGQTPTVTAVGQVTVDPAAGTLRLVGQTPTAVLGFAIVAPTAGTVRLVGQQPLALAAQTAAPTRGIVRLVGQQPLVDVAHKFSFPASGTIRIVGYGIVEEDFTATWTMLDLAVEEDFTVRWPRSAEITASFTAAWSLERGTADITLRVDDRDLTLRSDARNIDLGETHKTIELLAA